MAVMANVVCSSIIKKPIRSFLPVCLYFVVGDLCKVGNDQGDIEVVGQLLIFPLS